MNGFSTGLIAGAYCCQLPARNRDQHVLGLWTINKGALCTSWTASDFKLDQVSTQLKELKLDTKLLGPDCCGFMV